MATDRNQKTGVDIEFMEALTGEFQKVLNEIDGLPAETAKALIDLVGDKVSEPREIHKILLEAYDKEGTTSNAEEVQE